jgi:hypothetical protein
MDTLNGREHVTASGRPYTRETIQPFMSVSKGILAIAANMLAD